MREPVFSSWLPAACAGPLFNLLAAGRSLRQANPALWWAGGLCLALAVPLAAGLLLDSRRVTGAPVWGKPLKFALSIAVYVWTLGWLLRSLPAEAQASVRQLSWGVAVSMLVEQLLITLQAGRGTTSHFNTSTPLNAQLLAVMGFFVLAVTLMNMWAVYLGWHYRPQGPASYAWGVRWGLTLFLVGTLLGGAMGGRGQHTVGAPDGGPGLPVLNWSTRAGDLRVAHFLGIHALQALPLLGWVLSRWHLRTAAAWMGVGAGIYALLVGILFTQALAGQPVYGPRRLTHPAGQPAAP